MTFTVAFEVFIQGLWLKIVTREAGVEGRTGIPLL
jgi:hypothetical protein